MGVISPGPHATREAGLPITSDGQHRYQGGALEWAGSSGLREEGAEPDRNRGRRAEFKWAGEAPFENRSQCTEHNVCPWAVFF